MSEETPDQNTESPNQAPIVVNVQYIKDLSFEAPGTPAIFGKMRENQPDISVNVDVNARAVQDNLYEVILEMKAECKVGEDIGFIVELAYGGLFTLNVPKEHLEPVLLIECPRLLFPFARNILADSTRDGGFPPLMLGLVDFAGMYRARMEEQQKAGDGEEKPAEG